MKKMGLWFTSVAVFTMISFPAKSDPSLSIGEKQVPSAGRAGQAESPTQNSQRAPTVAVDTPTLPEPNVQTGPMTAPVTTSPPAPTTDAAVPATTPPVTGTPGTPGTPGLPQAPGTPGTPTNPAATGKPGTSAEPGAPTQVPAGQPTTAPAPAPAATQSSTQPICITPQTIDPTTVQTWARDAAIQLFSVEKGQQAMQLKKLEAFCFSPAGWTSYVEAMKVSKNLEAIDKLQLTVSSSVDPKDVSDNKVQVVSKTAWKVTVPLIVVYQNDKNKLTQTMNVDLVVSNNNNRLAIDQVIASLSPSTSSPTGATAPAAPATPTPAPMTAPANP